MTQEKRVDIEEESGSRFRGAVGVVDALNSPKLILGFRIAYLLLAFLSWNWLFVGSRTLSLLSVALVGCGAVLLLARLVRAPRFTATPGFAVLLLFAGSFAFSSMMNARYGVVENLQGFSWLTLEFFLLYAVDSTVDEATSRSHCLVFAWVIVVLSFLMAAVSIVMAYIGFSYVDSIEYLGSNVGGMFDGRLYGLYSDPNLGAICSLVSVFISVSFVLMLDLGAVLRVLLLANTILQLSYVGLSASRTALLACAIAVPVYCLIVQLLGKRETDEPRRRSVMVVGSSFSLAALAVVLALGSVFVYEKASSFVMDAVGGPVSSESEMYLEALAQSETIETWDEGYDDLVEAGSQFATSEDSNYGVSGRDVEGDYSTGRSGIWSAAVDVWKTSPLYGVTHRNFSEYVHDVLPDSYFTRPWTAYTTMHNVFVDTLVSQGVIGLGLLVVLFGCAGRSLVRNARYVDSADAPLYAALVASIIAIGVSALFYSEILYINTIGSVIFWSFLGMTVSISLPRSSSVDWETCSEGSSEE